jgi:hypothetical protein
MDFYEAWNFLNSHKIFEDTYQLNQFQDSCLIINVVKVNPVNNKIEDDETLNTKTQVWLECGEYEERYDQGCHDIDLDCGADTFEEAIIQLAQLVADKYGR